MKFLLFVEAVAVCIATVTLNRGSDWNPCIWGIGEVAVLRQGQEQGSS